MRDRIKLAAKITRPENVLIAFAIGLVGYAGIESKALKKIAAAVKEVSGISTEC